MSRIVRQKIGERMTPWHAITKMEFNVSRPRILRGGSVLGARGNAVAGQMCIPTADGPPAYGSF